MAQDPLNLLCIEPRFPGRLGAVADWLVRHRGYRVHCFAHALDPRDTWPESVGAGIDLIQFQVGGVAREPAVPWTRGLERGLCYAYGAWEVFDARRPRPVDRILGRSAGLGSTLFTPVSYPGVPVVNLFDGFLQPRRHDLADEDAPALPDEYVHWRRAANAMDLLDLENGVVPWTLTAWQRGLYPPEYRERFHVFHDGIDTRFWTRPSTRPRLLAGRSLPAGTRVVTFVARRLERLRGFDRFLKLLNRLMAERDDVVGVVVGGGPVERMLDIPAYGQDYAAAALAADPPPDPSRLWMLGVVPPGVVAEVLGASDLHLAPSRPFAPARSVLEAMAAGAVVLGWDSPAMREVLTPGGNGLLVDPADLDGQLATALRVLEDPGGHRPLADAAAAFVREHYDRGVCLPRLAALLDHPG